MRRLTKKERLTGKISISLLAGVASFVPVVSAAPVLDSVVSGGATVNVGKDTTITSSNVNNVINWTDFSVASGESVTFDGGDKTNNYLNIVTGEASSYLNGTIAGGNNVYVVNPNGVTIGTEANIDVGSLYVSTRNNLPTDSSDLSALDLAAPSSVLTTTSTTATADIVNLGGSVVATNVLLEGNNVRLVNTENFTTDGTNVNANVAIRAGGSVHIGYETSTGTADYQTIDTMKASKNLPNFTVTQLNGSSAVSDYEDYMLVHNVTELQNMQNNLSGNYMLAKDIDASATESSAFTPIGTNSANAFTGKVDGNYFVISDLNISNALLYWGLFGYTSGATIENLGVSNIYRSATNADNIRYAGAIAGYAADKTTINNVHNSYNKGDTNLRYVIRTNVTDADTSSILYTATEGKSEVHYRNAGGLVGALSGGSISNSYNEGTVQYGGGIVGALRNGASLSNVYNMGAAHLSGYGLYVADVDGNASVTNAYSIDKPGTSYLAMKANAVSIEAVGAVLASNSTKVVSNPVSSTDTAAATYSFMVDSNGNSTNKNDTWRIYEGHSLPLLRSFLQANGHGKMRVDYDLQYYTSASSTNAVAKRTGLLDEITYNGLYVGVDASSVTDSKIGVVGTTATTDSEGNTTYGYLHDVTDGAQEWFYAYDQNGYDLVGTEVSIVARNVVPDGDLQLDDKIYNGDKKGDSDALENALSANLSASLSSASVTANSDGTYSVAGYDDIVITSAGMDYFFTTGTGASGSTTYTPTAALADILTDKGIVSTDADAVGFQDDAFSITYGTKNVGSYALDADATSESDLAADGILFKVGTYSLADWGKLEDTEQASYTQKNILESTDESETYKNYTFKLGDQAIKGNITPRTVYVSLNDSTGINKIYDGTTAVTGTTKGNTTNAYLAENNVVETYANVTDTSADGYKNKLITTDNVALVTGEGNYSGADAGTYTDNDDHSVGVAYSGISLSGTDATNYILVAGDLTNPGDTLYDQYSDTKVASGSLYGSGIIKKRQILASQFTFGGDKAAHKTYDGTSTYDLSGVTFSDAGALTDMSNTANAAVTTGILAKYTNTAGNTVDRDITLTLGDTANFNESATETDYVADAGTGYYLAYKISSQDAAAKNYYINSESDDLAAGVDVYGAEGSYITPRNIIVALTQATDIDKTYDGTKNLTDTQYTTLGGGYVQYGANSDKLLTDDMTTLASDLAALTDVSDALATGASTETEGSTTKVKDDAVLTITAVYNDANVYTEPVNGVHKLVYEYEAADGSTVTTTDVSTIPEGTDYVLKRNSRDIDYTVAIQGEAAKNYTITLTTDDNLSVTTTKTGSGFSYTQSTTSASAGTSTDTKDTLTDGVLTVTAEKIATGRIDPRTLTVAVTGMPSKTYNSSAQVDASSLQTLGASEDNFTLTPTLESYETAATTKMTTDIANMLTKFASAFAGSALNTSTTDDTEDTTPINAYYGTGTTDATFAKNANAGTKAVQYNGLSTAWSATDAADPNYYLTNYAIADTAYGTGTIEKLALDDTNFVFNFNPLTKVYDGGTGLAGSYLSSDAGKTAISDFSGADVVKDHYIKLDDTHTLDFGYTINSAAYDSKNAYGTTGGSWGLISHGIDYTITLSGIDTSNFSGLTSGQISGTTTAVHTILPRDVTAAVKQDVTKVYDGTTAVKVNEATPAATDLITLSLVGSDAFTVTSAYADTYGDENNLLSAAKDVYYEDEAVSGNKAVSYTIDLGSNAGNYNVYNADGTALLIDASTQAQASSASLTGKGKITPATLTPVFTLAEKYYDGEKTLTNLVTTPDYALSTVYGSDDVALSYSLDNASFDTASAGTGKKVTYTGLSLTGTDAGNYQLESTSATGSGTIDAVSIGAGNLYFDFSDITKTYDATKTVKYTDNEGKTGSATDYVNNHYVSMGGSNVTLTWSDYTAAYYDANAADDKQVTYTFQLNGAVGTDYTITPFENQANGSGLTSTLTADGLYTIYTTGDITPLAVYATVVGTAEKVYDGTAAVTAIHDGSSSKSAMNLADAVKIVAADGTSNGLLSSLDGSSYSVTAATYDDRNVLYDTAGEVSGDKKVSYTLTFADSADSADAAYAGYDVAKNYVVYDLADVGTEDTATAIKAQGATTGAATGSGTITPASLTVSFGQAYKTYDADADVDFDTTLTTTQVPTIAFTGLKSGTGFDDNSLEDDYAAATKASGTAGTLAGSYGVFNANGAFEADGNVALDNGNVTYKAVSYSGLNALLTAMRAGGNDLAGNYKITGATATANAAFDSANDTLTYTAAAEKGKINQLAIDVANDLRYRWQNTVTKTYDGTTDLYDGTKSYVTVSDGTANGSALAPSDALALYVLMDKNGNVLAASDTADGTETEVKVVYNLGSAAYTDKNVGTAKNLEYTVTGLESQSLGNFVLTGNYAPTTYKTAESTADQFASGYSFSITPYEITPSIAAGYRKTYDGTSDATEDNSLVTVNGETWNDTFSITQLVSAETDDVGLSWTANFYNDDFSAEDVAANISPEYTGEEYGKNIRYTLSLSGNEKGNYVLVNGDATATDTLSYDKEKAGDIRQRIVYVDFENGDGVSADKTYNGTATVDDKKTVVAVAEDTTAKTGIISADAGKTAFDTASNNLVEAAYADANVARDDSGAVTDKDIYYKTFVLSDLTNAADDVRDNYVVYAKGYDPTDSTSQNRLVGSGTIVPRSIGVTLADPAVTKVYDGTTDVKDYTDDSDTFHEYATLANVTLADASYSPTLSGDHLTYTIADTGITNAGTGTADSLAIHLAEAPKYKDRYAGTGKEAYYKLTWDNPNYELAYGGNGSDGVSYAETTAAGAGGSVAYGGTLTTTQGIITPKAVTASVVGDVTKAYDGTAAVKVNEATPTAAQIITLTGLTGNDGATYTATGTYQDTYDTAGNLLSYAKDVQYEDGTVSGNKLVNYVFALDADNAGNYIIYDADGNEVSSLPGKGEITPASLYVNFGEAHKTYDGATDVDLADDAAGGVQAPTIGLTGWKEDDDADGAFAAAFEAAALGQTDNITPISGNYGVYDANGAFAADANVSYDTSGNVGYKAVSYRGLDAVREALRSAGYDVLGGNYNIAGATDAEDTWDYDDLTDTLYFKEAAAKGQIRPLAVTMGAIRHEWGNTVSKPYDGNTSVTTVYDADGGVLSTDGKAALGFYALMDASGNLLDAAASTEGIETTRLDLGYVLNGATYDDKNAGQGKNLTYEVGSVTAAALGNFTVADGVGGGTYTSSDDDFYGAITPRLVSAEAIDGYRKTYDNTTAVEGAGDYLNITQGILPDDTGVTLSVNGAFDDATANLHATDAAANGKGITYTLTLSGNDAGNYTLDSSNTSVGMTTETKEYGAFGDIDRAALTLTADAVTAAAGSLGSVGFTGTVNGIVSGDTSASAADFSWSPDTSAYTATSAGTYGIWGWYGGATTGDYGQNYTFSNAAANATALTLTAATDPVGPVDPVNPLDPSNPDSPLNPSNPDSPLNPSNPDSPLNPDNSNSNNAINSGDIVTPTDTAYTDASKDTSGSNDYNSNMTIESVTADGGTVTLEEAAEADISTISMANAESVVSLEGGDAGNSNASISIEGDSLVVSLATDEDTTDGSDNASMEIVNGTDGSASDNAAMEIVNGDEAEDAVSGSNTEVAAATDASSMEIVNASDAGESLPSDSADDSGTREDEDGATATDADEADNSSMEIRTSGEDESAAAAENSENSEASEMQENTETSEASETSGTSESGDSGDSGETDGTASDADASGDESSSETGSGTDNDNNDEDDDDEKEEEESSDEGEDSAEIKSVDLGVNLSENVA